MEDKETDKQERVCEMALCEQDSLILRANVLYRFKVVEGCAKCEELAAVFKDD